MALTDSLVAYWKLDEASGTRVDATGRGNDLATVVGSPGSAAGKVGNAVDTSSGNYLEGPVGGDLSPGNADFTIAAWLWFDALSGEGDIVNKWQSGNFEYSLATDGSNNLKFFVSDGSFPSVTATTFGAVSTSTWYFVVAWHDSVGDAIKIVVNDGTVETTAHAGGVNTGSAPFSVGRAPFGSPHDGRVDEVGFWTRLLTAGEITALYNGGAGLAYPFGIIPVLTRQYRQRMA
ncbi:MAG: LamG domain-containing protein [Pseudomonadota bacterium]